MTAPKTTKKGGDSTHVHSWMFEADKISQSDVLTEDGVENIATHQYVSGEYTHLDNLLNPGWTWLTELLPLWLAPNMVTTIGGAHMFVAYSVLWYYSPNMNSVVPDWALVLGGYCGFAYYTLDCMDGKQSRRTGTSSPLGQLFDHGVDCLCNMAHSALTAGYLMNGGSLWYFAQLTTLQLAFFCAQWEEYYTHVLPHGCGKWLGVTEVNYGLATLAVAMSFADREAFWTHTTLGDVSTMVPHQLGSLTLAQAGISGWLVMITCQIILSIHRVTTFLHQSPLSVRLSAVSKLLSPTLLALTPFVLPHHVIVRDTRRLAIALGIVFALMTNKMIVFSMAKMSFASLQMDILPYLAVIAWISTTTTSDDDDNNMPVNSTTLLTAICAWNLFRLISWCRVAIQQICARLNIYCFTIKSKDQKKLA